MAQEKLGAAVIGLRMGNAHLQGYARNPHTRVVGVCDTNPELLEQKRKEFGAGIAVADYRELIHRPDIGIVSVVTPDYFHAEQVITALEAGKDVLCDKPLTLNLEEARHIVATVRRTGRKMMVGQVCRFAPGFALAKRLIERGEIGELFLAESEYAHNYGKAPGVNRWRVDSRRDPFIGGGCHAVDLLRWIAGETLEVSAYSNHKCLTDWPVNDCTMAIYKFTRGVIGKVMVSIGCVRPYTMRSVFYGTEGTIICDNTSPELQLCRRANCAGDGFSFARLPVNVDNHNVAAEIDEFVACVRENRAIVTDAAEGARTVAACVAAVESARTGKPVAIATIE